MTCSHLHHSTGALIVFAWLMFAPVTGAQAEGDLVIRHVDGRHELALGAGPVFRVTPREVESARLIDVPNSDVRVAVWNEVDFQAARTPFYAISHDGTTMTHVTRTSYDLLLRFARFDPLSGAPAVPESLRADASSGVYIVQFITQPLEVYRAALELLGARIGNFLANHAYIVTMTAQTAEQAAALPVVRAITPYHPAYRLEEALVNELVAGVSPGEPRRYSIMLLEPDPRQQALVADRVRALGGTVENVSSIGSRLEASIALELLPDLARMDEVLFIDVVGEGMLFMDIARQVSGADFVEDNLGFTGQGVAGEVIDSGLFAHQDFNPFPDLHGQNCDNNRQHGTNVYGIVFGDGTGNPQATGVLPDGDGIFVTYDHFVPPTQRECTVPSRDRFCHTAELVDSLFCPVGGDPNCPYDAVFQTNSWGTGPLDNAYSTVTAEMDRIAFDLDLLICQAHGNCGGGPEAGDPRCQGAETDGPRETWAKNVVSVGGIKHLHTAGSVDDFWCLGGSFCATRGPAADGRIKPDLAHFFDRVFTTSSIIFSSELGFYIDTFSGTSAATPITCGHFGLMFQMWHEGLFCGYGADGATVFESRPRMSTARALMLNTAFRYPMGQADLTRNNQGWGRVDVERIYELRENFFIVDQADLLSLANPSAVYVLSVAPGEPELRATLVYSDPPGNPASSVARANGLSLRVTAPSGTCYLGNHGLDVSNWSAASADCDFGTSPDVDTIDTVENVFLQNPESGLWTVEVFAAEINDDGHLLYQNDSPGECCNDPAGCVVTTPLDTAFALVVSGADTGCQITGGGCCLPDGFCRFTEPDACAAANGTFLGTDSTCQTDAGGCCLPDGDCESLHETCCASRGGTFLGMGSTCQTDAGGCCLAGDTCESLHETCCASRGGAFGGIGTTCGVGACCFPDGSCDTLPEGCCASAGGAFEGEGVDCSGALGRCCMPDGPCVNNTSEPCCYALGGWLWEQGKDCCTQPFCPQLAGPLIQSPCP